MVGCDIAPEIEPRQRPWRIRSRRARPRPTAFKVWRLFSTPCSAARSLDRRLQL